ncbi:SRPBCC family protein [Streptomyces sp. YIM S03343]
MPTDLTGSYLTLDDGRPAIRFSRVYDHPVDRVWTCVTDPAELAHWFPSHAEFDLRAGGTVTYSGDPCTEDSTGTVVAVDPPRHLAFTWGGDELRFDLEDLDGKRTRFTLTNVLEAADTAARNCGGWEVCLLALDATVAGAPHRGPHSEDAADWAPIYRAYVAAGVPSGAPVPPGA